MSQKLSIEAARIQHRF